MSNLFNENAGMDEIIKSISRLMLPFIITFGGYIIFFGHLTPGGGFSGGVILASGFLLITMAFGKNFIRKKITESNIHLLDSFGSLLFAMLAAVGFAAGYFFKNSLPAGTPFTLLSGGQMPLINFAIGVKIAAGLFGIFLALSMVRVRRKGKERVYFFSDETNKEKE